MSSILQVTTFYRELGGVERVVRDLSQWLSKNHTVKVLCTDNHASTTLDGAVTVERVGSMFFIYGRPLSPRFLPTLRAEKPDVVHYHLPFPLATGAVITGSPKAKVKIATWHHDIVKYPKFNTFYQPLLQAFLSQMDAIVVGAEALIESNAVLAKFADRCHVIPLGIEESRFTTIDTQKIRQIQTQYGSNLVLFVGRLVYYKGVDVLIKALEKLDATALILGTGPLQDELEALAKSLGISHRVHFLGYVDDADLANYYAASSLFVLPSISPTECYGLVQAEAMMCGKPVINTNLPTGVPWVSQHGETGITVPPGDPSALAEAIKTVLSNDDMRQAFSANAKKRARSLFTLDAHGIAIEKLYSDLLSETSPLAAQRR